jgi:tetratricopeptide (TPR) repeat protein
MLRGWLAGVLLLVPGAVAAAPNPWAQPGPTPPRGAPGPTPEVSGNPAPVALPPVPNFAVPAPAGGIHTPFELLAAGERLRGTRLQVGGYITWIHDCAVEPSAVGRAAARREPAPCERPKLLLGDTPGAPGDRSLWVVDLPRALGGLEWHLPGGQLAPLHHLAVGDYVVVTGTLAIRSPHREINTTGLIVYEALAPATAPVAAPPVALAAPVLPPLPARVQPAPVVPPARAADTLRHASAGHRAYASRRFDTAIAEYEAALRAWSGNAAAWYGLAGARSWRGDLRGAADAAAHSTALVPDQAMYWLLRGRLLYEAAIADARSREARAHGGRADLAIVDRAQLDFAPALEALRIATSLEPRLWRAHDYLGRVLRDRGDARAAAEQLSQAIAQHAWEPGPYLALGELYRRWRFGDQALAIAELGSVVVPGSAEIWFALGLARDDRGNSSAAIAAYSRALELRPDLTAARFRRGQAFARQRNVGQALRDLRAVVQAGGTSFDVEQARRLLIALSDRP